MSKESTQKHCIVQQARKQIKQQRRAQSQSKSRAARQSCTIGTADQLGQGLAIKQQGCTETAQSARPINWVKDSVAIEKQSCTAELHYWHGQSLGEGHPWKDTGVRAQIRSLGV